MRKTMSQIENPVELRLIANLNRFLRMRDNRLP